MGLTRKLVLRMLRTRPKHVHNWHYARTASGVVAVCRTCGETTYQKD